MGGQFWLSKKSVSMSATDTRISAPICSKYGLQKSVHKCLMDCTAYINSLLQKNLNFWWVLLAAKKGHQIMFRNPPFLFPPRFRVLARRKRRLVMWRGKEGAKEVVEGAGSEVSKILWLFSCFLQLTECFCVPFWLFKEMQEALWDDEYLSNTLVWRWVFLRMHLSGFASYGRWR